MSTNIGWVRNPDGTKGETWNPIIGCSKASPGCANCYAETIAGTRLVNIPSTAKRYQEVITDGKWNGKTFLVESELEKPLRWKKPRTIFVCSMGDLFHESVKASWIDKVFAVMALCPQHRFMVLTKRPERMARYFNSHGEFGGAQVWQKVVNEMLSLTRDLEKAYLPMHVTHLPNVWLGTTVENQEQADKRIPHLLRCPASLRFLSVEPMLNEIDLRFYTQLWADDRGDNGSDEFREEHGWGYNDYSGGFCGAGDDLYDPQPCLGWVICGGESGKSARPMDPEWVRSLRDQCKAAEVPFFFKQWGEWLHESTIDPMAYCDLWVIEAKRVDGFLKVGKNCAGRRLDGVFHDEFPEVV
ncbi:hypothetical protein BVY04_03915 [bacterium M21]|nr:hypothetical protein BVY04_03915 [bacterium M21]